MEQPSDMWLEPNTPDTNTNNTEPKSCETKKEKSFFKSKTITGAILALIIGAGPSLYDVYTSGDASATNIATLVGESLAFLVIIWGRITASSAIKPLNILKKNEV